MTTILTLDQLTDSRQVTERLIGLGFAAQTAAGHAQRFAAAAQRLIATTGQATRDAVAWFVPGRIEVFGKHTDYAGGRSVVAAAERGFCGVAVARADQQVQVYDVGQNLETRFLLSPDLMPPLGSWSNYPLTVARRMVRNFPSLQHGAELAFASDLPAAAGMSSSSALMVLTFLLLGQLNQLESDDAYRANIRVPEDLAGYLGTVENGQTFRQLVGDRGVGTFGGSEDHTAILLAQAGQWVQYAYCPVRLERTIQAPVGYQFLIGVSGVVAEKTGAARELYNRAARRARTVHELFTQATGSAAAHLAQLVHEHPELAERGAALLSQVDQAEFSGAELVDRWVQFLAENERIIPALPDQVTARDLASLAQLASRSHQLAVEKLGNQIPETIFLADQARQLGAVAASAQGAGFGGSVWALVKESECESLADRWSAAYRQAFPAAAQQASFFATRPGPPATAVS